jgi:hypothetical protein
MALRSLTETGPKKHVSTLIEPSLVGITSGYPEGASTKKGLVLKIDGRTAAIGEVPETA